MIRIATINANSLMSLSRSNATEFMSTNKIDILMIQETLIDTSYIESYRKFFSTVDSHWIPGTRHSGGLCILVNPNIPQPVITEKVDTEWNENILHIKIITSGKTINLVNIYAPNDIPKQNSFFRTLDDFLGKIENPKIIGGDWNTVTNNLDFSNRSGNRRLSKQLNEIIKHHNLIDTFRHLHPTNRIYSFTKDVYASRIDRIYCSADIIEWCRTASYIPGINSDHQLANVIQLSDNAIPVKGKDTWMMNNAVLEDRTAYDIIKLNINSELRNSTPSDAITRWLRIKEMLKKILYKQDRRLKKLRNRRLNFAKQKMDKILDQLEADPYNNLLISKHYLATEQYIQAEMIGQEDQNNSTPISQKWKPKHDIFKRYKNLSTQRKSPTVELKNQNGDIKSNPDEILEIARLFYQNLYSKPTEEDPMTDLVLDDINTPQNQVASLNISKPISVKEVKESLYSMNRISTPGPDGLSYAIYKAFPELLPPLKDAFNLVLSSENPSDKLTEGTIVLIPKSGDLYDIKNYRPITLLNCDYKIITKSITFRITSFAKDTAGPHQFAFTKGRKASDNVMSVELGIKILKKQNSEAGVIFLDWKKAYDKINHNWLWLSLKKFGLSDESVDMLKRLYTNAYSKISINGHLSKKIMINRGVRQGDSLSCQLFNIALAPLSHMISKCLMENSESTRPILYPVIHYADDTCIFIEQIGNLIWILNELDNFSKASGAEINWDKTALLKIGEWISPPILRIITNTTTVTHLGFPIDENGFCPGRKVWPPLIEKCKRKVEIIRRLRYPIEQAKTLFNSIIGGKVAYFAKFLPPNTAEINELEKLQSKAIWEGKPRVNRLKLSMLKSNGGMQTTQFSPWCKSFQLQWISELHNNRKGIWQQYFWKLTDGVNPFIQSGNNQRSILGDPWSTYIKTWNLYKGHVGPLHTKQELLSLPIHKNPKLKTSRYISANIAKFEKKLGHSTKLNDFRTQAPAGWKIPNELPITNSQKNALQEIFNAIPESYIDSLDDAEKANAEGPTLHVELEGGCLDLTSFNRKEFIRLSRPFNSKKINLFSLIVETVSKRTKLKIPPDKIWYPQSMKILNPKEKNLIWLMRHNALALGKRLCAMEDNQPNMARCPSCTDQWQDHRHLFSDCPITTEFWSWIQKKAKDAWPEWTPLFPKISSWTQILLLFPLNTICTETKKASISFVATALYTIWIARCRNKYENADFSPLSLRISFRIRWKKKITMISKNFLIENRENDSLRLFWLGNGKLDPRNILLE